MVHQKRVWGVKDVNSLEELVSLLTQYTWTACTGFHIQGFLFLNDSFGEDSIQEYGVVREDDGVQVESITIWDKPDKPEGLLNCIRNIIEGHYNSTTWPSGIDLSRQIQQAEKHKCYLCM